MGIFPNSRGENKTILYLTPPPRNPMGLNLHTKNTKKEFKIVIYIYMYIIYRYINVGTDDLTPQSDPQKSNPQNRFKEDLSREFRGTSLSSSLSIFHSLILVISAGEIDTWHGTHGTSIRYVFYRILLRVATVATVGSGKHVYCDIN